MLFTQRAQSFFFVKDAKYLAVFAIFAWIRI